MTITGSTASLRRRKRLLWVVVCVVVGVLCLVGFLVVPRYMASQPLWAAPAVIQTEGIPLPLWNGAYAGNASTLVVVGPGGAPVLRGVNPATGEESWSVSLSRDIDYDSYKARYAATDENGYLCLVDSMAGTQVASLVDMDAGTVLAQVELPVDMSGRPWVRVDGFPAAIVCRANTLLIAEPSEKSDPVQVDAYEFHKGTSEPHQLWTAPLPASQTDPYSTGQLFSDVIDNLWVPTSVGYQSIPTGDVAKLGSDVYDQTPIAGVTSGSVSYEQVMTTLYRQTGDGSVFQCLSAMSYPAQVRLWDRATTASAWSWAVPVTSCDSIYVEQFNNSTTFVVTNANDGRVSEYDYDSGVPLWVEDEAILIGLAAGEPVASVNENSTVTYKVFDLKTGDVLSELETESPHGTTVTGHVVGEYLVILTATSQSITIAVHDVGSESTRPLWRTTLKLDKGTAGVMGGYVVVTCGNTTYMVPIR